MPNADEQLSEDLVSRAGDGDEEALRQLFSTHSERLKRMIRIRLDRRLRGRVDASDILQDSYLEVAKGMPTYVEERPLPFYLWLRNMVGMKLTEAHRFHLGTQRRDAARELATGRRNGFPAASSITLAAMLLGKLTSPSQAVAKGELRLRIRQVLEALDPIDREVLTLRHFEQLSTSETACVLGLSKAGAGSRYLRAVRRMKDSLAQLDDFRDTAE